MRTTVSVLAITALLLAGCGSSITGLHPKGEASKPAGDVLNDALNAAKRANGVHISGRIHIGADKTPFSFDITTAKTAATGKLNIAGFAFQFIRIGDDFFMKGNDEFLARMAGAGSTSRLHGKWIEGSAASHRVAVFERFTTLAPYLAILNTYRSGFTNAGESIDNDKKAVELYDSDKKVGLDVALTGVKYPVALYLADPTGFVSRDEVRFDRWNTPVSPKPPRDAVRIRGLDG